MRNYKAKSAIVSRKPNKNREGLWSVLIALFDENNAHLKGKEPRKVIECKEVSEVEVKDLVSFSFFPTGNDVVINDLENLNVDWVKKEGKVVLRGKQLN
ncbi:MAG: hypothetical protein ABIA37_00940 [Candidatus Woesearchaeota archaeon]